ncbi:MAG: hypothetical protein WCB03_08415 [Rouxiella badensis]|uniref:hypothetical protein n=1 Tax=Rouxiella badensis TaxID=1646377 RepID=UPI003C600ED4
MTDKKSSRLFSFRAPADVAEEIEQAVRISGKDKTAWMLVAVLDKLGKPSGSRSPESRMETLIGQMEALLGGSGSMQEHQTAAVGISTSKTALTAKDVIAEMVEESKRQGIQSSNKVIVSKLNELGIRPARGEIWTTSAVDNIKRRMK